MVSTITPLFFWQALVCFGLFINLALAVLQNVTVDDAAGTGLFIPTYLPNSSVWAQGDNCPGCLARPDPSFAYNATWHDTTYHPNAGVNQSFEFAFTGSGLYIFFILANTASGATTFTNVNFILDGAQVSTYTHNPTSSTDYEYNQTVYANGSLPYGEHMMQVVPVDDTVNSVLILFDYLIYTTDTGSATTTSTTSAGTITATAIVSSPTSTGTTSSGPNTGAIVGSIVAGVSILLVATGSLLCYQRHKRRTHPRPSAVAAVEPFILSGQASSGGTSGNQQLSIGSPPTGTESRKTTIAPSTVPPSSLPSAVAVSSTVPSSNGNTEILEQVGMLRNELAFLRQNVSDLLSEPPPGYA